MTTTIHLSGPADILTVLPYQLGFHPDNCIVAVSLRGTRMGLVQRIDIPPTEHVVDAVDAMIGPLLQEKPRGVLLIGFEDREGQSRPMLDALADACEASSVRVNDRMVVRGGRWFDLDCALSCCPPEGLALPAPSEVPAVAEFVGRGIFPLPDRSALADLLEPSRTLLSRAVSPLAEEWLSLRLEADLPGSRASELALWAQVLCDRDDAEPIRVLPPQDLAILAVSLTDVDLRDALIAWLCPGALRQDVMDPRLSVQLSEALPGSSCFDRGVGDVEQVVALQRIERRLCELCAALPDAWAVPSLTVLAAFTWWRGDGALTRIALDRALRVDPQYRLAQLMERMVDLAIRPERASA